MKKINAGSSKEKRTSDQEAKANSVTMPEIKAEKEESEVRRPHDGEIPPQPREKI